MSPDSPDAQIFKEYGQKHESKNGTAATGTPAAQAGKQRDITLHTGSFFFNHYCNS
jgi:hypothetical protein